MKVEKINKDTLALAQKLGLMARDTAAQWASEDMLYAVGDDVELDEFPAPYDIVCLMRDTADQVEQSIMDEISEREYDSYLVSRYYAGKPVTARMAW
jgi:hypothetical protein